MSASVPFRPSTWIWVLSVTSRVRPRMPNGPDETWTVPAAGSTFLTEPSMVPIEGPLSAGRCEGDEGLPGLVLEGGGLEGGEDCVCASTGPAATARLTARAATMVALRDTRDSMGSSSFSIRSILQLHGSRAPGAAAVITDEQALCQPDSGIDPTALRAARSSSRTPRRSPPERRRSRRAAY